MEPFSSKRGRFGLVSTFCYGRTWRRLRESEELKSAKEGNGGRELCGGAQHSQEAQRRHTRPKRHRLRRL